MALAEGDKAECKEIIKEVLVEHIAGCPHGLKLFINKVLLIGICVGSSLAEGGAVVGLLKLLIW